MAYLPKVYIGLFNMLIDSNKWVLAHEHEMFSRDVRGAAELCLAEFLTVFKKTYISKTGIVNEDLFRVILLNNQRNEYPIKKTNIIWVKELAHLQPQVIHFVGKQSLQRIHFAGRLPALLKNSCNVNSRSKCRYADSVL